MHPIRKLRESGHATAADYETLLAADVVFHRSVLVRTVEGRTLVARPPQLKILAREAAVPEGLFGKFPKQTIREIFLENRETKANNRVLRKSARPISNPLV